MRRIVSAGLPSHVASFLARQLEDVSVLMTFSGDDTLAEVRGGRCGLVLLDSDIGGLPAESVLHTLREDSAFDGLSVVYCLAESDKAVQEASRQRLLREYPGIRVLLQPLGTTDVARTATQLLYTPGTRDFRILESAPQPMGAPFPSVPAFPLRRAS